jgi:AcrR family transcriptional regulator
MALTRQRVLKAAIRLADKEGIDALSMRRLARALGVEAMSLYNHVANKGDLVDGIVELVVGEIELPPDTERWDAAIRRYAVSAHAELVRHPWAAGLVIGPSASGGARPSRVRHIEWLLRRLREGGFPPELAFHAYHVLDAHILGFTLWEIGHDEAAARIAGDQDLGQFVAGLLEELRADGNVYLAEHAEQHIAGVVEGEGGFAFGLDLILDGLSRARRNAGAQKPT